MQVNLGATDFKHTPQKGFVGFASAVKENIVENTKKGSAAAVEQRKIIPNAPQAIIIEVFAYWISCFRIIHVMHIIFSHLVS